MKYRMSWDARRQLRRLNEQIHDFVGYLVQEQGAREDEVIARVVDEVQTALEDIQDIYPFRGEGTEK